MKKRGRNSPEKTYLFVDGSNLYAGQYELFGPDKYLDFAKFINEVEKLLEIKINKILFYASYSPKSKKPSKKEKAYLKNEGLFYKSVKQTRRVDFFKGYRSKTSGKEKEVDVKLAVDLIDLAYRNKYDRVLLISGDADFMHALVIVKRLKKQIDIVSLHNRIPYRLSHNFNTFVMRNKKVRSSIKNKRKLKNIVLNYQELVRKI